MGLAISLGILGLVAIAIVWVSYGRMSWSRGTRKLRSHLQAARHPIHPQRVDFQELAGLPEPVQRYFRTVLQSGQPLITSVAIRHRGTFNLSATADQWQPFTSDQVVITQRPGFDWHAQIRMLPGLSVWVHDAYVAGEGLLHAALFGLISLVKLQDSAQMAEGELMRFFAEAAWYPTALLPSQGVTWQAIDDHSAFGTLTDGDISLTLRFTFDAEHRIERMQAASRGRMVGQESIPTPWQCRVWDYTEREGMVVPLAGEVAWLLPEGDKPYWRGQIAEIHYEFTV